MAPQNLSPRFPYFGTFKVLVDFLQVGTATEKRFNSLVAKTLLLQANRHLLGTFADLQCKVLGCSPYVIVSSPISNNLCLASDC